MKIERILLHEQARKVLQLSNIRHGRIFLSTAALAFILTAAGPSLKRGDCNHDGGVDAGDLSALTLEIFDGDGTLAKNAPNGTFSGSAEGCDSNRDEYIDAGDLSCTVLIIFDGPDACPAKNQTQVTPPIPATPTPSPTPSPTATMSRGNNSDKPLFGLRYEGPANEAPAREFQKSLAERSGKPQIASIRVVFPLPIDNVPTDFSWVDSQVQLAIEHGLIPYVLFWVGDSGKNQCSTASPQQHVRIASELAERFDGDKILDATGNPIVQMWGIDNEVDQYGCPTPQSLALRIAQARDVIKAQNPDAKITTAFAYTPGKSFDLAFPGKLRDELSATGCQDCLDVAGLDVYTDLINRPESWGSIQRMVENFRDSFGWDKELMFSETGGTSAAPWHTETSQARELTESLTWCNQNKLYACIAYKAVDDDNNPGFGLIDRDGLLKPAGKAYETAVIGK